MSAPILTVSFGGEGFVIYIDASMKGEGYMEKQVIYMEILVISSLIIRV